MPDVRGFTKVFTDYSISQAKFSFRHPRAPDLSQCGSGWSVPCVSIQLTLSQHNNSPHTPHDRRAYRTHNKMTVVQIADKAGLQALFAKGGKAVVYLSATW